MFLGPLGLGSKGRHVGQTQREGGPRRLTRKQPLAHHVAQLSVQACSKPENNDRITMVKNKVLAFVWEPVSSHMDKVLATDRRGQSFLVFLFVTKSLELLRVVSGEV